MYSEACDAARYNAPTSQGDAATCPRWYSNLGGKAMGDCANGTISTFRKRDCIAFIGGMRTTGRSNWNFVENVYLFMEI